MRIVAAALSIVVSSHFAGGISASVALLAKGKEVMVTTQYLPSAGFEYLPTPGSDTPEALTRATRIVDQGAPPAMVPKDPAKETPVVRPRVAAQRADPKAAVLCNRGLMQMQAGNYRGAISDFESAMRISPKDQRAIMLRGVVAARQGNHPEALGFYNRALGLGPGEAEVYQSRGLTYMKLQRFKEAIDDFSKAVSADPQFEEGYVKRGLAYGRIGEFEKSVADYTRAIALNPSNPLSYNNRAAAYQALGKGREADADIRKSNDLERQGKQE